MWQAKYASAVSKNLGVEVNFPFWASVVQDFEYVNTILILPTLFIRIAGGPGSVSGQTLISPPSISQPAAG